MVRPLISVVTVCYNAVNSIEKTIQSVINQTYSNIEYIIIDGGSTDGTVDIIKKYADKVAYWVSGPDKGIYDAMNKGICIAKGEWINFMNAGDVFYDNYTISDVFTKSLSESLLCIYGDVCLKFDNDCRKVEKGRNINTIKKRMVCCHQSLFLSLKNKNVAYFDTRYCYCADYDQLLKISTNYGNAVFSYFPRVISIYENEVGVSSVNRIRVIKENLKIHRSYGCYNSIIIDAIVWVCFLLKMKK